MLEHGMTEERFLQEAYLRIFIDMPQETPRDEAVRKSWETAREMTKAVPIDWRRRFGW